MAWHYNQKENTVYIDDVLYHDKRRGKTSAYVDDWNHKAKDKKVTISDYAKRGYVPYKTPAELEVIQERIGRQDARRKQRALQSA